MHSIQEIGLQEPIDVLEVDGKYYGFSGCHRYEVRQAPVRGNGKACCGCMVAAMCRDVVWVGSVSEPEERYEGHAAAYSVFKGLGGNL